MTKILVLFLLASVFSFTKCARILGVFPMPSHSHYKLGVSLMMALAEKGHDVTMISAYEEKTPPKKGTFRSIVLTGFSEMLQKASEEQNMFELADTNPFMSLPIVFSMITDMMGLVTRHENVQKLLHSDERFDAVIVEQFFNEEQKAFASHFKAPLIIFNSIGTSSTVNSKVGNPTPLAYVPDMMLEYSSTMTFCERVINVLFAIYQEILYHFLVFPKQNAFLQNNIPNPPQLDQIMYNASLVLLNSHPSINQPVPYVPNMIDVGGLHLKPPKELPQDLKQFLDGAKDGVIYFSMGSNLKSAELPPAKREELLKAFSKLKQKVLWKWEDDKLPGQPANVKLAKWLPQNDILAHPNIKLFITHGGYLSTTETIYHGVPVLAIPVYGDQKLNAKVAVTNGFGLTLPFAEISEEKLMASITELLQNSSYRNNAKKRSGLFHDRLVGPLDTAIYWVEYVVRHGGAPHLRVAGLDLPWWKYHLLDVFAFLVLIAALNLAIVVIVVKKLCRKLCSKSCLKTKKKTKTQ